MQRGTTIGDRAMDSRKLRERLMATFLAELETHVRTLGDSLLRLEQEPGMLQDEEFVKELFRSAHSLKGAAHAVEVPAVEVLCHALEDVFARIRDHGFRPRTDQVSVMLQALDAVNSVADGLQSGRETPVEELQPVCERIRAILSDSAVSAVDGKQTSPADTAPTADEPVPAGRSSAPDGQDTAAAPPDAEYERRAADTPRSDDAPAARAASASPAPRAGQSDDRTETRSESVPPRQPGADAPAAAFDAPRPTSPANGTDGAERTQPRPSMQLPAAAGHTPDTVAAPSREADSGVRMPAEPRQQTFVRVAAEKLDDLMDQAGELLTTRQRIEAHPQLLGELRDFVDQWRDEWRASFKHIQRALESVDPARLPGTTSRQLMVARQTVEQMSERFGRLQQKLNALCRRTAADVRQLHQTTRSLQGEVYRVRMFPFEEACVGVQRTVRDIAVASGKQVGVEIRGGETEVDRSVLEALREPLLHLVRNAVDHGIETPAERIEAGKPPQATLVIEAAAAGGMLKLTVRDDGRGIDLQRIREKSRRLNLPDTDDAGELLQRIFRPGFSTAEIITNISGRGIGLDVVKSRLERLGGTISVQSELGLGTRFTLSVPLSLATVEALLVRVGGQVFAIPIPAACRLLRARRDALARIRGRQMLRVAEAYIPVVRLSDVLRMSGTRGPGDIGERGLLTVVVQAGEQSVGLVVDEVLADREVVVKSFGKRIRSLKFYAGATLLPDGSVGLVLNPATIVRTIREGMQGSALVGEEHNPRTPRRLLVVEDSVTTRALMKGILESAGYEVTTAVDGRDAWERLQQAPFDLVVSDVDMPRMDGFELTRTIRATAEMQSLPVVLVTSRATEEDKRRGVEAGANAYLTKSEFDQSEVLEIIRRLV
ncbi:MAG: response regulator [Planctomycetota bacterium]|nr:MAG: response regulator [Planctomycetota bacterium]